MNIGHNKAPVNISSLNAEEIKTLKKAILEMNDSLTRVSAEKQLQKDILARMQDELGLNKKLVRKIAVTYFNANFVEEENSYREFEEGYNAIKDVV